MSTIDVRTQAQLDDAIRSAKPSDIIAIRGSGYFDLSGSATVRAYDSATVTAYGSATVRAYDSATVWASGSATVTAYGSATVTAYGSATVRAYDSATVRAGTYVAVHHRVADRRVKITGGVLVEVPELDTPTAWCAYHDVAVRDGIATLYKAVSDDHATSYSRAAGIFYVPGTTVEAPDFRPTPECGAGLHACAHPIDALVYHDTATRYVAVTAPLADLVVIDRTKVKVPRLTVVCEVDIDGAPIAAPKAKRTRKVVTK